MSSREVYPSAPLRLVTTEFRFPLSPVLAGGDVLTVLTGALGSSLPIVEPVAQTVQVAFGGDVPAPPVVTGSGYRLLTRDRTVAVTVAPTRLAVEITTYRRWETFRDDVIRPALEAIGERLGGIVGLDRIGLRYFDEVRVPSDDPTPARWASWIHDDLLAPMRLAGDNAVKTTQGLLHLARRDDREVLMRYGALEGHVIDDSGPLRLPTPVVDGPFFLIDIDSYWTRSGVVEEFDVARALMIADGLHDPVGELFERSITDRLRDEVLRRTA